MKRRFSLLPLLLLATGAIAQDMSEAVQLNKQALQELADKLASAKASRMLLKDGDIQHLLL